MKDIFEKIREIRRQQPAGKKTVCVCCINRIEKMIHKMDEKERKRKNKLRQNINKLLDLFNELSK